MALILTPESRFGIQQNTHRLNLESFFGEVPGFRICRGADGHLSRTVTSSQESSHPPYAISLTWIRKPHSGIQVIAPRVIIRRNMVINGQEQSAILNRSCFKYDTAVEPERVFRSRGGEEQMKRIVFW